MKFWQKLIPVVILMLTVGSGSFADIIDPNTGFPFQYKANLTELAPVIDGFLDDPAWGEAELGKLEWEIIKNERWHSSDDFTGTFAAVWRNGFLYVAIELTDDQIETQETKLSRQDHLEIYLDPDHTGHKSDLYRYILPVGENHPKPDSPIMLVAWGNGGQSCELSFNLRQTPRIDEDKISFGIYYNDVDGGRLLHKISWTPADEENALADLVFTAKIKPNVNQKVEQWGRIKSLY